MPSLSPTPAPTPDPSVTSVPPVSSIAIGSPAPEFTLPDQHGADWSLTDHRTRRPTLLVFYPFAFSRICGGELRELQSSLPEFEERETTLLAISCDPMYALRVYAEQEDFDFPLVSDFWPHGAVARAYGVFDETRGCARRGSFLIDQGGIVRWSVVNPISEPRPLSDYFSALTH
jgi:mycoredoxin-dependent peroxiredoxin